jgi:hypothetical protein
MIKILNLVLKEYNIGIDQFVFRIDSEMYVSPPTREMFDFISDIDPPRLQSQYIIICDQVWADINWVRENCKIIN